MPLLTELVNGKGGGTITISRLAALSRQRRKHLIR